ncbi:MAG: glycosyltransferase family 1 protein [Syntrophomonadaceae bacterium]|nr:glycosyltransferase family 1 protein [Syntrophomonadaceae bacterium]
MKELQNENIICVSSVDWEPLWTRKQQVMSRLPASNRILYVEPPISWLSPLKDPARLEKWRTWREGIRQVNDNIFLISPPVMPPFGNIFPGINRVMQSVLASSIIKAMEQLDMKDPILWTYLHTSAPLIGKLGEKLVVYDCVDEHSEYKGFNPQAVRAMEKELLTKADLVFVTARGLYQDKEPFSREIHLSPNAADVDHFMQADNPLMPIAPEVRDLPSPVLGFVGAIKEWVDLDLLQFVAESRPDCTLLMIGPVGTDVNVAPLQRLPNVVFLGHQDRKYLPRFLKGFDVCLNPFRISALTSTVSPLKFYEYLASGRPIASVPMPEIMEFSDVVQFGEGREGFLEAIEKALDDSPDKKYRRLVRAQENSWESRVSFMMDKISNHL